MRRRFTHLPQAFASVIVFTVALVALVVWGAREETQVSGIMSVETRGGLVYLSANHRVLVADESGRFEGFLEQTPGKAWSFEDVSNITASRDGSVLVSDAGRHEVVRFDSDHHHGAPLPLHDRPRLSFESAQLGDALIIADTMGWELRVVDASGATLHRKAIRYANGLSNVAGSSTPEHVVLANTADRHAVAVDGTLTRVADPAVTLLNLWLDARLETPGTPPTLSGINLLDLHENDQGVLVATVCRTTTGDCSIVRADATRGAIDVVGDISALDDPRYELSDDFLGVSEIAERSDGAVLVASPRLRTVLVFEGARGGPPPGRFCVACSPDELEQGVTHLEALEQGEASWPNGTHAKVFGDARVRAYFDGIRKETATYQAIQRWGKLGLVAMLALLLLLRFIERQGGASTEDRLREVWRRLVAPEWRALLIAWLIVGLGAALGGLILGGVLWGAGGAIGGVAAGGFLAARLFAAPYLLRARGLEAASRAWETYLAGTSPRPFPLEDGERWTGARFAYPVESLASLYAQVKEARSIDDGFEALEQLAPRLVLIATTDRRVVTANTSLLGAPLAALRSRRWSEVPSPLASVRGRVRIDDQTLVVRPGDSSVAPMHTGAAIDHCIECRAPVTACKHGQGWLGLSLGSSLLLPGLGHLAQARFSAARVHGVTALALLGQALQTWLPQHWGTLPSNPLAYQRPLWGYAALVTVAALDVWRVHRRQAVARARTAEALRDDRKLRAAG
jgi:hypothetical protein